MQKRSHVQYRQGGGARKDVPASVYNQKKTTRKLAATFPAEAMAHPYYRDDLQGIVQLRMIGGKAGFQPYEFEPANPAAGKHYTSMTIRSGRHISKSGDKLIGKRGPSRYAAWIEAAHAAWIEAGKPRTFEYEVKK
jgi:hypothetical protein